MIRLLTVRILIIYFHFHLALRSLGLTLLEAATGNYPYDASGGPLQLMIQVCYAPPLMCVPHNKSVTA